mmetsp:Transcript_1832/g.8183  ORF Transcript_1832/g.8183 Transcript_1832/m.8183 type:complete len:236 (+) Transcript_1832:944-1651(+)
MADTSVHRPCRMMSTALRTEGTREVNGAAIEASPSFTCGVSMSSAPSISCIICENPGTPPPPFALARSACLRLVSVIMRPVAAFMALNWAHCSPAAVRRVSSSSNQAFWSWTSSFWSAFRAAASRARASFTLAACSLTRSIFCAKVSALASVGTVTALLSFASFLSSSPAGVTFLVLAPPKPLRSATPTCACLSAPTSLAPSPHMNVCLPCCFSRFKTRSLSSGDMRAKMTTESR